MGLDRLDDPQLRSSHKSRSGRSGPPQLAKRYGAGLPLGGGLELEFADDVVRVIQRALHPVAPDAEPPTIELRSEQAAETRRKILRAAQELFEREGYAATSMAAIASAAGVSLKTR